jgi:hypothetical protein
MAHGSVIHAYTRRLMHLGRLVEAHRQAGVWTELDVQAVAAIAMLKRALAAELAAAGTTEPHDGCPGGWWCGWWPVR